MRAFTNQQINDMYDVLKRDVLTKGLKAWVVQIDIVSIPLKMM